MSSRAPAPGALRVVQEFVNTLDLEEGLEQLPDAASLRAWLVDRHLTSVDDRCTRADLQRAVAVREALRGLLLRNAGDESDGKASAVLDRAAQRARFSVRFQGLTAHLEPAAVGVDGAIGRLLAIVTTSMAEGTWARLKACRAGTCRWAFYDHSRNGSGAWCDMAVCGSREKMRTYRRRQSSG